MEELIKNIKLFIASLQAWLSTPKPPIEMPPQIDKVKNLENFIIAVRDFEGYHSGSRSFRNLNPGNLKYTSLTRELGATGKDSGGFASFPTYEVGLDALRRFVKLASENELGAYKNCTILSFFQVYSPENDGNPTLKYANWVASRVNCPVNTLLKDII